jgi:cell division protein FtsB
MSWRQKFFLSLVLVILFNLFLMMIFGDKGLVELGHMKRERGVIIEKNIKIEAENLDLYRKINRLKTDATYIERVAREELGMIGQSEVVVNMGQ